MNRIIMVSGFGRCGSSLVMQMLEAGGVPMTGEYPAFEAREAGANVVGGTISKEWLATIPGHAIKVLDPQNGKIPSWDFRIIWCQRDTRQQALSQTKFLKTVMGMRVNPNVVRDYESSYWRDFPAAIRALEATGPHPILKIDFESIIDDPMQAAHMIAIHVGGPLDISAMARVPLPRSTICAVGMDIEVGLIRQRKAATRAPGSLA
jgi:hypothetical protein